MLRLAARRITLAALTLLLVSLVVFLLLHLAPGDPLSLEMGEETLGTLTPARVAELRSLYHLDQPIHRQYLLWLEDLARGNLGRSFRDRRLVTEKIGERIGITLSLNLASLVLMMLLAVPMGAAAAWRPGGRVDRWTGGVTYALYAVPVFWAALLLQIGLSVRLGWLPLYGLHSSGAAAGWIGRLSDRAAHMVLPVTCLTYGGLAYLSRFVRANLVESALGEAARAARARGVSVAGVILRHGFRQAAVPMLTLAGFLLPALLAGSVIVETVFSIPGLGRLLVDAVLERDIPVVMGLTLLSGAATLAGILLADLAYAAADPRVRHGDRA